MTSGILLPTDARVSNGWRRGAVGAVAAIDRAAGVVGGGRRPVAEQLSRRKLWGLFHHGAPLRAPARRMIALSFDLDYQEDTDALGALVDVVDRRGATMSVVAIGRLVDQDPGPYEAAVTSGHEIVNHTWSHPDNPVLNPDREWWDLSVEEMVDEVVQAQDVFERRLGARPRGFRTPHFKDVHRMLRALEQVPELEYLSTVLAPATPLGLPYFPALASVAGDASHLMSACDADANSRLLQIPLSACPEHRWSQFGSYHTIRAPHRPAAGQGFHLPLDDFERLWRTMLAAATGTGFVSVYFDPKDVMRDSATADRFGAMLAAAAADGWEITSLGQVAAAWRQALRDPAE